MKHFTLILFTILLLPFTSSAEFLNDYEDLYDDCNLQAEEQTLTLQHKEQITMYYEIFYNCMQSNGFKYDNNDGFTLSESSTSNEKKNRIDNKV